MVGDFFWTGYNNSCRRAVNVFPEDALVSSEGDGVRPVSHDILCSQTFDLGMTVGPGARFHVTPHPNPPLGGTLVWGLALKSRYIRLQELSVYGDLEGLEGNLEDVLKKLGVERRVAVKLALAKNRWE